MDDKLVEDVARAMADAVGDEWDFCLREMAEAAIAVVRAAVIEECARHLEEDGSEFAARSIRALAKETKP